MANLRVLAIDTALGAVSVAVLDVETDTVIASQSRVMERGHAEILMPMIESVLKDVPGGFDSLDRFAVTVGPGSFTGLRIGISAARGFALAANKPVVGVSALSAYVAPMLSMGDPRPVAAVIDARHGMVFFQLFAADGRSIAGPGLFSLEEAARKMGDTPSAIIGNAAELLAAAHLARGASLGATRHRTEMQVAPDIAWVARLGAVADPTSAPARPLYLREASAVPQDRSRIARV